MKSIIKNIIGNNGKITKFEISQYAYFFKIKLVSHLVRNNRINKTYNYKYWGVKFKKSFPGKVVFFDFENDTTCTLLIQRIIQEERKLKLNKINDVNKE